MVSWCIAFWKFSRPHTIIGTSLSVIGLWVMAIALGGRGPSDLLVTGGRSITVALPVLVGAWLACLAGNIYIVGLNQLTDVDIDRINKPHLPLAAGTFSQRLGWILVGSMGAIALLLSLSQGPFLVATVWSSLAIGTAYSLPPVRLKRFPLWASICIFTVRGVIVNLGLFLHFNQTLHQATTLPSPVWLLTLFVLVFTFAIAIFKDIPDLEGDRQYQITTFTLKLGVPAVFNLARGVITLCYGGMVAASLLVAPVDWISSLFHTGILGLFWLLSLRVNLQDRAAIARFYQFIWRLFFLEYLVFPILSGLGP
ncbi:MAG: homogentisate phytyltransferase [Leptolyngbyaceae bacterium]|nr:homogentisate phytyltransferase [Leptolyngbyaceae bacterium]